LATHSSRRLAFNLVKTIWSIRETAAVGAPSEAMIS